MKIKQSIHLMIIALFALSCAIFLTLLFKPLFSWTLNGIDTQNLIGLSQSQVINNYDQLLDYLIYPWTEKLQMSDIPVSTQGAFHFMEVKRLFFINNVVFFVSSCTLPYIFKKIKYMQMAYVYLAPLRMMMYLPIVLAFVFAIGFNFWFIQFHHLFFNNNAWLFNPQTDPIILVLPEYFFLLCFVFVIAILELILLFTYRWLKKNSLLIK